MPDHAEPVEFPYVGDLEWSTAYELASRARLQDAEAAKIEKGLDVPDRLLPSPRVRQWIYGVLAATGPVLTFYGVASGEEVGLWLGVAGVALFGVGGLAAVNVPPK